MGIERPAIPPNVRDVGCHPPHTLPRLSRCGVVERPMTRRFLGPVQLTEECAPKDVACTTYAHHLHTHHLHITRTPHAQYPHSTCTARSNHLPLVMP